MFSQESIVCSSLPFLFLIEQMERHSLADLGKRNRFWGILRGKHFRKRILADLGISRTLIRGFFKENISGSSDLGISRTLIREYLGH